MNNEKIHWISAIYSYQELKLSDIAIAQNKSARIDLSFFQTNKKTGKEETGNFHDYLSFSLEKSKFSMRIGYC